MNPEITTAKNALVTAADTLAAALPGTPVGEGARVTGIVLHGLEGVLAQLFGDELEQARKQSQALHQAAGASADLNSRLPGLRDHFKGTLAREFVALPLSRVDRITGLLIADVVRSFGKR